MKNWITNIALSALSVAVTFASLEIGLRIYKNEFRIVNFLSENMNLLRSAYPAEFDPELGWMPKAGRHDKNVWSTEVTILEDGLRSNGGTSVNNTEKPVVLAVGDSYTFGDQVSDNETWPAILERIGGFTVLNGGVFGYGIDQTYLRMLKLQKKYNPNMIIFGFFPDDIARCELSVRASVPKPYFELTEASGLALQDDHVRSYRLPREVSIGSGGKTLGWSYFIHKIMMRTAPEYWLQGSERAVRVNSAGAVIACQIFQEVQRFASENDIDLIFLAQYIIDEFEQPLPRMHEAVACIDLGAATFIDISVELRDIKYTDYERYKELFFGRGHMTHEGNQLVAETLLGEMEDYYQYPYGHGSDPQNSIN